MGDVGQGSEIGIVGIVDIHKDIGVEPSSKSWKCLWER